MSSADQELIGWVLVIAIHLFPCDGIRAKKAQSYSRFNVAGVWCSEEQGMAGIFLNYFRSLFLTSNPSSQVLEAVLQLVENCIPDNINELLMAPFSSAEVRKAVFDLHPSKAPGPDGFTALFYQKSWPFLGDDITTAVLSILNGNGDLKRWNNTMITLIPKVKEPQSPKDFRPISLCNTCYKIISRAITNRLRLVIYLVIDQSQIAFVPGRLIKDNIIIGFECIHWIRKHNRLSKDWICGPKDGDE